MKAVVLFVLLVVSIWSLEHDITYENSNFTLSRALIFENERVVYNYNRFRITDNITHGNWFVTAIGDIENYLAKEYVDSFEYTYFSAIKSDTPFKTQTSPYNYGGGELYAQLYRLYGGYGDDKHLLSVGLQKISMGVGRIWNPTDLFNPTNPLALEPDEVYGVFALSYSYAPSDLSEMTGVAALREDDSLKYAARVKGYLSLADAALNLIYADDAAMVGYELEGGLFDTGIELRSEGGYFEDKILDESFFQAIFGADYGFENSLYLTGEWLYTSEVFDAADILERKSGLPDNLVGSHNYFGASASYEFDMLLYGTLFGIVSIDDGGFYASPSLNYSLADDMSLSLGAMLYGGGSKSEFGEIGNSYYLNIKATF